MLRGIFDTASPTRGDGCTALAFSGLRPPPSCAGCAGDMGTRVSAAAMPLDAAASGACTAACADADADADALAAEDEAEADSGVRADCGREADLPAGGAANAAATDCAVAVDELWLLLPPLDMLADAADGLRGVMAPDATAADDDEDVDDDDDDDEVVAAFDP